MGTELPEGAGGSRQALVDASEAAEIQRWVAITYRQLSAGHFSGRMEAVDLAGIGLFQEQHDQDVNKSGALPRGQCTISFIDRGDSGARFSQFVIDGPDVAFFQPECDEFDIVVPAGRLTTYARIDQDELINKLAVLSAPLAEQLFSCRGLQSLGFAGKAYLERSIPALLAISADLSTAQSGVDRLALRRNLMEQLLIAITAAGDPRSGCAPSLHGRRRAWRIVRAAREHMEAQLYRGIVPDLHDLCAQTRVSERTLRYAFRDQLGCSPSVYLRLMRLNGVRAELLNPIFQTQTVTAAATRWGFVQLGRFAQDYRSLFKELPSATLARALGVNVQRSP
ncbi:MAG: hypothetical protein C1943_14930 [Halochromatium sp.]|nr:hypothetical protein [Halochromatium sp.]